MKPWNDFFDTYTVIQNHLDDNASLDGAMFETYGPELEFVKAQDPNKIWTQIEAEGNVVIAQGFHFVNCLGYLITVEDAKDDDFEFGDDDTE